MKMMKEHKISYVKSIVEELSQSEGVIIAGYQGLSFLQMDTVRRNVKEGGNDFRVIKNTLLKKALAAYGIQSLDPYLVQSTALVIVRRDFAAAAKSMKKYAKDYAPLKIKAGLLENKFLHEHEVVAIADLPSRSQLLAITLATMNAPVQNFVSVLANIPRSLLNALNAIKDQKAQN